MAAKTIFRPRNVSSRQYNVTLQFRPNSNPRVIFNLCQQVSGEKRPAGVDMKKPKTPKKKKRKDPNEPVKPVSAYALFFRDTQANIKAQNPNATFGEVSKNFTFMFGQ